MPIVNPLWGHRSMVVWSTATLAHSSLIFWQLRLPLSWKWTVCQRSIRAAVWTTAWFGRLSFDLKELCLAGEAWKFVSDLEKLRCNAGSNTLYGVGAMYAFFLMTSFWYDFGKLFSVPRISRFVFRDQWEKAVRQGKVVISKSAFFSIKDALVWLQFSQIFTPGSGLTKG